MQDYLFSSSDNTMRWIPLCNKCPEKVGWLKRAGYFSSPVLFTTLVRAQSSLMLLSPRIYPTSYRWPQQGGHCKELQESWGLSWGWMLAGQHPLGRTACASHHHARIQLAEDYASVAPGRRALGGRTKTTGAGCGCGNVGIRCAGPVQANSKNKWRVERVLSVHARNMLGYNAKKTTIAEAKLGSLFHVMTDLWNKTVQWMGNKK